MSERKSRDKRIVKKIFLGITILIAAILLLLGILACIDLLLEKEDLTPPLPPEAFFSADYTENIFEDEAYMRLNRSVYYKQYDSGEILTEENYEDLGTASEFFYHYFNNVISGNYNAYHKMLTETYLQDDEVPDRFTMQMLYDIQVNQVQAPGSATYKGEEVTVFFFEVKYKIFRNNGTFRNDVGSNQSTTQYYHLYSYKGQLYLNSVQDKWVVIE